MPRYITFEDVRIRTVGKVRYSDNEADENKMQEVLAKRLIDEAESQVELDLSVRYFIPFKGICDEAFSTLKSNPEYIGTWNIIKTLCELQSVIRILETDFGSGTTIDASKYIKNLEARYKDIIENRVLKKRHNAEDQQQWFHPPMKGMKLALHNKYGDDGYVGTVLDSSSGDGGYPATQISDPSENWFNARLDD